MPIIWPPGPIGLGQTRWMYAKDWLKTRRKFTVPLALAAMLALVFLVTVGIPGLISNVKALLPSDSPAGKVHDVKLTLHTESRVELSIHTSSAGFPDETAVRDGMELALQQFETTYQGCTLHSLAYDKDVSEQVQKELLERYKLPGVQELYLITGSFTTGEEDIPQGLEPNTTYDDLQWVFAKQEWFYTPEADSEPDVYLELLHYGQSLVPLQAQ